MATNRSSLKIDDAEKAVQYLESVPLAGRSAARERLDGAAAELPMPKYEDGSQQVITVGSQIAEFSKAVPAERRSQIANSFLLAQLAANKAVANSGSTEAWYARYVEVLANVGWLTETETFTTHNVSGTSNEVHREIIPILSAVLGPAVAAATLVKQILDGLSNMEKDNPWITLFSKESERVSANQFQVSVADVPPGKEPQVTVACFELNATKSVTQVLFFKFSQSKASLRYSGSKLSMNAPIFDRSKQVVEDRVAEYVKNYVAAIQI